MAETDKPQVMKRVPRPKTKPQVIYPHRVLELDSPERMK